MMTLTVCGFILIAEYYWVKFPPGTVPVESRKMTTDLLTFMIGVISGYLGSNHK